MSEELLPCVFCGKEDHHVTDNGIGVKYVMCFPELGGPGCGATSGGCKDEASAIKRWNARHGITELEEALAAAKRELAELRKLIDDHSSSSISDMIRFEEWKAQLKAQCEGWRLLAGEERVQVGDEAIERETGRWHPIAVSCNDPASYYMCVRRRMSSASKEGE